MRHLLLAVITQIVAIVGLLVTFVIGGPILANVPREWLLTGFVALYFAIVALLSWLWHRFRPRA